MSIAVDSAELHRLTLEEYHQMVESGALEEMRVELIDGWMCDMSPRSSEHENAVEYLNRVLALALNHDRFRLRPGCALTIERSEPEPDLAVVRRGTPAPYHPSSAELAIEVAVSSQRRDLVVKPPIYAAASVTEYWVIDIHGRRAIVHRDPRPGGYRSIATVGEGGSLDGGVVGIRAIALSELLAAAGSR